VTVRFVEKMPGTTWNDMASSEYGFYSNVNPNVDHPAGARRQSAASGCRSYEQRRTTLMFNGYGNQVASL